MKEDEKKEENKQEPVGLLEAALLFLEAYINFPRYRP